MSHNTDPHKSAQRHPAPMIAIVAALIVAVLAAVWFMQKDPAQHNDVSRVESTAAPAATTDATPSAVTTAPATGDAVHVETGENSTDSVTVQPSN